jgi:haloacid dehalogenase-like hydrolase, putative
MSGIRNEEFLSAMQPNYLVDGIGDVDNIKL